MEAQSWLTRRDHGAGIIELQMGKGPDNGLDTAFLAEIEQSLIDLAQDSNCKTVVLGSPFAAFCAGTAASQDEACPSYQQQLTSTFQTLIAVPKPTIAAVNGNAHGPGLLFAICCDIAIGRSRTTYRFDGVAGGTMLPAELITLAQHRLGQTVSRRLFLTNQELGPIAARNYGLLDILAEDMDDLWTYTLREAKARIKFDPVRYATLKRQLWPVNITVI